MASRYIYLNESLSVIGGGWQTTFPVNVLRVSEDSGRPV